MKNKTSVTLSIEVLAGIDRYAVSGMSRSDFIEDVLQRYLAGEERARRDARDVEMMNKAAPELNAEIEDVLEYQAPWD